MNLFFTEGHVCRARSVLIVAAGLVLSLSSASADTSQILTTALCTPTGVASFDNRIHVHCSVAVSGVVYFAAPTSNPNRAARLLALLNSALVGGRNLIIYYDAADTGGTSIGCLASNCRLIQAAEII